MIRTALVVAASAAVLAACGNANDAVTSNIESTGPVVAEPQAPINSPVDTTPTGGENVTTPGANSFTEGQARSAIAKAGYTNVGALTQSADGLWQGQATKGSTVMTVSIDYKGAISAQ